MEQGNEGRLYRITNKGWKKIKETGRLQEKYLHLSSDPQKPFTTEFVKFQIDDEKQHWCIEGADNESFRVRNRNSTNYITMIFNTQDIKKTAPIDACPFQNDDNQKWILEPAQNWSYRVKSAQQKTDNRYLTLSQDKKFVFCGPIIQNGQQANFQLWKFFNIDQQEYQKQMESTIESTIRQRIQRMKPSIQHQMKPLMGQSNELKKQRMDKQKQMMNLQEQIMRLSQRVMQLQQEIMMMQQREELQSRPMMQAMLKQTRSISRRRSIPIPGFKGKIVSIEDSDYINAINQYATSSFEIDKMTPFLILYPTNETEVAKAINYAKDNKKKIVARSGGHQYTGKSSGGNDTIVLSMDSFNKIERINEKIFAVGPCVKLKDLAQTFKDKGVTIPHGQCPLVNIGGHAQTGGYGHLLRGFGLCQDYVQSFDIVLADGTIKTVTRPTEENYTDQQLFRAVLGGNAGSFGVITKYTFNVIQDSQHPQSYGFKVGREYNLSSYKKLMKEVQQWSKLIEKHEDDEKLKGLDFMMTIRSNQGYFIPNVILVELVYSDPDKGKPYSNQFQKIISVAKSNMGLKDWGINKLVGSQGKESLSSLSQSFVRKGPLITDDGREFKYPFKKRVNGTKAALTDKFIDDFCSLVDEAINSQGINLIFQMGFGGGAHRAKGREKINGMTVTSIPNRDVVFSFVFDLFYEQGQKYQLKAIQLQRKMQEVINSSFNSDSKEKRYFWGSFGDTNMNDPTIRAMYYDSEDQYIKLQKFKEQVDPSDIFHTEMTVQLPKKQNTQEVKKE